MNLDSVNEITLTSRTFDLQELHNKVILLHNDVIDNIFQKLTQDLANLPSLALVCKSWKEKIDDKIFRQLIRPVQAFGRAEWKKFMEVDCGEELPLPRRAFYDLETKGGSLIFIPKKVKIVNEENEVSEIVLDNLKAIGELVEYKTGFSFSPFLGEYSQTLMEQCDTEESHWTWMGNILGKNKTYDEQRKEAEEGNTKISGMKDTVITYFMEFLSSKTRNIEFDQQMDNNIIRVHEKLKDKGLCINGFLIGNLLLTIQSDTMKGINLGFLPARKSFYIK